MTFETAIALVTENHDIGDDHDIGIAPYADLLKATMNLYVKDVASSLVRTFGYTVKFGEVRTEKTVVKLDEVICVSCFKFSRAVDGPAFYLNMSLVANNKGNVRIMISTSTSDLISSSHPRVIYSDNNVDLGNIRNIMVAAIAQTII